MQTSAKYLIHATVRTSGVVERSDVVGAIFGQTEGLLGDELDLRELQDSSKLGRIDVSIESEAGRSVGSITIGSCLERAETAVLGAALETIDRVGPCRADCTVTDIEDARAAKRRELVERATELLNELESDTVTSEEITDEVRRQARVEEITEYKGLPAGPRVEATDAVIVVEGRADVRRLLKFGVRNAIAVEGTDVPPEIAELTFERNATAYLDGDRGGDLILRELQQVADIDYVAFAPTDQSVEDLDRAAILSGLRRKVPAEQVTDGETPREAFSPAETIEADDKAETDEKPAEGSGDNAKRQVTEQVHASQSVSPPDSTSGDRGPNQSAEQADTGTESTPGSVESTATEDDVEKTPESDTAAATLQEHASDDGNSEPEQPKEPPQTLASHTEAIIGSSQKTARFLDSEFNTIAEAGAGEAFETLNQLDSVPSSIVLDDTLTQRLLDLGAQLGVRQIIATETDEFVKQPTDIRVRTARDLEATA
ncbi:DNA primase DnaG [Halovenus rubra]|uniref:DNA primase DnaG n=2 Tax=Halovenus rubra TaxID=869890 RepID=A0ACC7DZR1_9EURY|nr:DNA primase DnaG [Halovenus rubra]